MEQTNFANAAGARDMRIDRMKGLLCLMMLLAHTVFYLGYEETGSTVWKLISHGVNLVAFPGFLFCFGFVCERAYLHNKDRKAVQGRLIRRFFIILAAYYVSALAMNMLLAGRFSWLAVERILHLNSIKGVSYLLAFAVQFLVLLFFYPDIDRLLNKGLFVAIAVALSLGVACLPVIMPNLPLLSLFLKTADQSGFPLLPYAGFFLLGAYLSRRKLSFDWRVGLFALLGGMAFAASCLVARALPPRFPPSVFWVLGGYPLVYALYLLSGLIERPLLTKALAPFGRYSLYYLTASNILLALYDFISRRLGFSMPRLWYIPCYIALLLVCLGLFQLYKLLWRKRAKA